MTGRILISAGEPSGDILAAGLLKSIHTLRPDVKVKAMGGDALRKAGAEIVCDIKDVGGVMGFTELGRRLGRVITVFNRMKQLVTEWRPELVILVDYGDFNLRLAKYASKQGIPVLYYVPPKVWAWRRWRIKDLARYTSKICVIYPYEKRYLESAGVKNVEYCGNPWADEIVDRKNVEDYETKRRDFLFRHRLNPDHKVIALFPGSREGEIKRHIDAALGGLRAIKKEKPEIQVLISVAPSLSAEILQEMQTKVALDSLWIKFAESSSRDILLFADSGLIKSGTSNLEAALTGLPFVMFFKVSPLTELIVKYFVKIREYSPVNILSPNTICELLQDSLTPARIADELSKVTFDEVIKEKLCHRYSEIRNMLSVPIGGDVSVSDAGDSSIVLGGYSSNKVVETSYDRSAKIGLALINRGKAE